MNFSQVIEPLRSGETVRRKSWRDGENLQAVSFHSGLEPDFLMILDSHSRRHYSPTMRDLLADDWVIVRPAQGRGQWL